MRRSFIGTAITLLTVVLGGCLILPLTGCSQIERERDSAVDMGKAIALKILDKSKIDQSNLNASADVTNPEYQFAFSAGTGIMVHGSVRAIGVIVRASVAGGGSGEVPIADPDLRSRLQDVLTRTDITKQARKDAITASLLGVIDRVMPGEDPAKPSPVAVTWAKAQAQAIIDAPNGVGAPPQSTQPPVEESLSTP